MTNRCYKCGAVQPESFADLVAGWRGDRSQKQAGEAAGVSYSTISRAEAGELPDIRSFVALVQAIGVSPTFAFDLIRAQMAKVTDEAVGDAKEGQA